MGTVKQISGHPKLLVDDSSWLWRYVRLSTLFLNLSGTVYVPTIAQLKASDPKEGLGALPPEWRFAQLLDQDPTIIEALVETLPPDQRQVFQAADPSNVADLMHNSHMIVSAYDNQQAQMKCAWCWHCSSHESAAMWKLYADSGAAIQTTLRGIASAAAPDVCFEAATILYGDRESGEIDSFNSEAAGIRDVLTRGYLFKNNDYEFEREVRLIIDAQTPGCGRVINNMAAERMIEQIVICPWTKLDEFEALYAELHRLCPKALITRSSLLRDLHDEKTARAIDQSTYA